MIYVLFVLFVVLQVVDAAATIWGIRNGLKEANPVMRFLIGKFGLYVGQAVIRLPIIAMAFWKTPAFWISAILMSMVFMLLVDVFYVHPERYDGNLQTQVVTALLLIIGMVSSYWLGTSASSQRKTELMSK